MKKFNAKQFFINHSEKLALGVFGLLALWALASANWATYDKKRPQDITTDVAAKKEQLQKLTVTPEQEESLGLVLKDEDRPENYVQKAVLDDWRAGRYDFRVAIAPSPNDVDVPAVEPAFQQHPIRNLIASSDVVLLNLGPEQSPVADATNLAGTPAATPATPPPAVRPPSDNPLIANLDAEQFADRSTVGGGRSRDGAMSGEPSGPSPSDLEFARVDDGGAGMGGSYAGQQLRGRGQAFVSVRGVIPLHELIRDVQKALNIPFAEASQRFQIIDYQLERQTMLPDGTWPPDDQWEPIDRVTATGILKEVDGFDIDPVQPAITVPTVTMPLPARITGIWTKDKASHPDIDKFTLTPQQLEQELAFQRNLVKKLQEEQALAVPVDDQRLQPGGFTSFVADSNRLGRGLMGGSEDMGSAGGFMPEYQGDAMVSSMTTTASDPKLQELAKQLATGADNKPDAKLMEYIKSRISAVGSVLLFRFLDFAVEPGKSYRYRARLEIENPNRLARINEVADASVIAGDTRFNAWSNVTPRIDVLPDTHYFIADVEADKQKVLFDFVRFDSTLGTYVSNLEADPGVDPAKASYERLDVGFGEPIGGTMKVWELDPAKMTFSKATKDVQGRDGYLFNTGDLLVTGLDDIRLNKTDHPLLDMPITQNRDLQLVDAVLVAKKNGRMVMLDSINQTPWREYAVQLLALQNKGFQDLKEGKSTPAPGSELCPSLEGLYGPGSAEMMAQETPGGRNNRRRSSSLRLEQRRGAPMP